MKYFKAFLTGFISTVVCGGIGLLLYSTFVQSV